MNWLLLRGLAREQRHWHEFRDLLASRVGGSVHLVDVAGVGTQHRRVPHPSVRWMARDVARRLPALTAPEATGPGLGIVGLSLGGMLALELCRAFPRRVQAAVIVNASSRLSSGTARMRPAAALQVARAVCLADPERRERLISSLTSALPEAERARYARVAAEFSRDAPPSRWTVLAQLSAAARFYPPAASRVRAHLRFICSANDALVSPRCTRDLARWFQACCDEHPWAGHDLPLDDPTWLCERIAELTGQSLFAAGRGREPDGALA